LRSLIARGISPASVTSAAEEETRRVFQAGRAVFMRNWPYALTEAQRPDSNIRGRVAVSALPSASGEPGPGALGGYFLGVNPEVDSPKARLAEALVAFLTGHDAARDLALAHGRNPARRDVYHDPLLDRAAPQIASLLPLLERAQARPTTPYYAMLSDTLQAEFSAAIGGIRPPEVALRRAQALADHIIGATR
jgi:multiple sugar transport system substrate-binding protein